MLTSRLSVEMVQKAAALGAAVIAAVSAPTALALRTAEAAGITVIGVARDDGFEVFTRPDRIGAPATRRGCVRPVEKLVMMANQIARNVRGRGRGGGDRRDRRPSPALLGPADARGDPRLPRGRRDTSTDRGGGGPAARASG